jgi:hypothetical protein
MEPSWPASAQVAVHVAMGVALAASAGLRAFLPLLVVGGAARLDLLRLADDLRWLSSTPALVVFGVAVVCEVLADKIPFVDHVLDAVATAIKPLAGALVMTAAVHDWEPLYLTVVGLLSGAVIAGGIHLAKAKLRLLSSLATAGAGNPVLSVTEDAGALAGTLAALWVPVVAAAFVLAALPVAWWALRRGRRRQA